MGMNQQYMPMMGQSGLLQQGYLPKSKMRPGTTGSVRSKSQRSRGSHISHKRRLEAAAKKKPGRFNEELETVSRKSNVNSRVSRKSHASKASKAISQHSRRPGPYNYQQQAPQQSEQAISQKKQELINQIKVSLSYSHFRIQMISLLTILRKKQIEKKHSRITRMKLSNLKSHLRKTRSRSFTMRSTLSTMVMATPSILEVAEGLSSLQLPTSLNWRRNSMLKKKLGRSSNRNWRRLSPRLALTWVV